MHAKVSGYIRHIYVDIGDRVRQGQILADLEVPELNAQLKGTVSEVASSKDEITRAEHEVFAPSRNTIPCTRITKRLKQASAAQPGLIAEQELDDAESKDLASGGEVDAAKSALVAATQDFGGAGADNERVSALADTRGSPRPINGVIVWRYADTGALIQSGTSSDTQSLPVVKLSQSELVAATAYRFPRTLFNTSTMGAEVKLQVEPCKRSITGKIVRFTRDLSLATRTMETEVDVQNKDLSLTPGMYANTTLELERRDKVLTIPVPGAIRNGNQASVLVVDEQNHVQTRRVILGLQATTLVEVTERPVGGRPSDCWRDSQSTSRERQ